MVAVKVNTMNNDLCFPIWLLFCFSFGKFSEKVKKKNDPEERIFVCEYDAQHPIKTEPQTTRAEHHIVNMLFKARP